MKKTISAKASDLESHIGFWLRFVSNQVSGRFENLLAEHDISIAEWVAMRALYPPRDTTHAELIDALGMTKGAASKIISKLEVKGLVERNLAKESRREQVLHLTKMGQLLVPKLASLADENETKFFGHLTEKQRQSLMNVMKDLIKHHQLREIPIK